MGNTETDVLWENEVNANKVMEGCVDSSAIPQP